VSADTTPSRYASFRGSLRAGLAQKHVLVFVTVHPEGRPTAVYRLDLDKGDLDEDALPGGAVAIVEADGFVFVAGTDGKIHRGKADGGDLAPLGEAFDPAPVALAVLSEGRLAAISGATIVIVDRVKGKRLQTLPLPDAGTALAADASGAWLVAGTSRGTIAVFDGEERRDFIGASSKKIHEGAVTALLFDPDEPRVYSGGSDGKLLLTHVRGELEPEDRAGGSAHDGAPTTICVGLEDKLYTGGRDGTIKTWTRGPKKRPSTLKDGVGNAVALMRVEHKGRAHLALLAEDATIRLFPLDAGGKVNERSLIVRDAYALAEHAFEERAPERRETALRALAAHDDARAIEIVAARASGDADHGLRALATTLLGATKNPRAVKPLEALLTAGEEQVRLAALSGLRAHEGQASLRPLELALGAKKRDVGAAAVTALTALAKTDDQAMARLVQALDDEPVEVRAAAVAGLEELLPAPSAEAVIIALRSRRADIRRLALVRAFQRHLLGEAEVLAALRRHEGDPDADVRRAAFLVSLMTRPALAEALGARDRDLAAKLGELATFGQKPAVAESETKAETRAETKAETKASRAKAAATAEPKAASKKARPEASTLVEADLRPLLEAMASRALDTCLAGARGLASLQDERAFGTLLQLTNEKQPSARVEACRALADLGDARGLPRLRQLLRDGAGEVRDAAFSSLAKLEEQTPLRAAEAGLLAPEADVRGRALQLLVRLLKKDPPKDLAAPAAALLSRALDDSAGTVRGEAFKAALAIEIGGGGATTLRFALRSVHAEVRREVLNEVMGRIQEPWAAALLLDLLGDPDAGVRGEAFDFSQKRSKGKAPEPLAAALAGRHVDLKLKTIEVLAKRRVDGARALLEKALGDEAEKVRIAAACALLADEASAAMESPHADVRVRAAAARAILGDARALAPLLGLVTEKEPELAEKREAWIDRVARALRALGELGSGGAQPAITALATHKDKRVAGAAVEALGGVARPDGDLAPLKDALSASDADLKRDAALGLAAAADPAGLPVLKGLVTAAAPLALRGLAASIALGEKAADLFMAYLDHDDEKVRGRALLAMMLIESSEQDGAPDRCLAALSSAHPRVRLTAARALESFADPQAFTAFVLELLNERGDDAKAFTIPGGTARILAEALTFGDPQLKVRTARLLDALDDDKQDRFDHAFAIYQQRFAPAIDALLAAAKKRKPAAPEYAEAELRRVVTGAYAGLSRQLGGALEVRVRQTAIARLAEMARLAPGEKEGILPLLLLALGDPVATVRKLGFDTLVAIGMPSAELGAEALAVGQRDVGAMGLALLASGGEAAQRRKVLEQVFLVTTDGLQDEAGKLLLELVAPASVHEQGLLARAPGVRDRSVAGLAELWESSDAVKKALRNALTSRYGHVREGAAIELAGKKDPAAFAALVTMLDGEAQRRAIEALGRLGDPRAPDALLDRIDRDPAGTAMTSALLSAAAAFRLPAIAPRLLAYLDDRKKRSAAFSALLTVSGYDQEIQDPELEGASAEIAGEKQHPRHDAVLAQLLDATYRLGDVALLGQLLPAARWAPPRAIDAALAPLATFAKDDVRDRAVEALGFRLRKRGGSPEPLIAALSHSSPVTQLFAAEGLALAGRADGIRVLLTGIDLLPELDERRRAVRALGKLADPRGLDPLLRLVNEEGHALQEEAAEALGHLKATPKGPQIEAILLRLAAGNGGVARQALAGLRWFDSLEGWRLVRDRAKDDDARIRVQVAEILAHSPDPASRAALIDRLENEDDYRVAKKAAESLRKLDGDDSLEPDYALACAAYGDLEPRTVERLRERGDAARILELLPKIPEDREDELVRPLTAALLARSPLPLDAAAARLESVHERVAQVAAQIVARAGKAAAKAHGKGVIAAAQKAAAAWIKARAGMDRDDVDLDAATERYRRLVDALGKLEIGDAEVLAAASLGGDDAHARPVRVAALTALASGFAKAPGLDALASAAVGNDGREREIAAGAIGKLAPERAAALAPRLLDDRDSLRRLLAGHEQSALVALRGAALKVHTQGVALPLLIEGGDVAGLAAALTDRKLPEATRLGAIEALARIATDAAFAPILALAKDEAEDEELRKGAWRALRRGRRYLKKKTEQAAAAREASR
jgi:ParB family chromosome partitioning protein